MFLLTFCLIGYTAGLYQSQVLKSALSNPSAFRKLYNDYQVKEGRHYTPQESRLRAKNFRKSVQEVLTHNEHDSLYKLGLNQFSDMTEEEKLSYTGANLTAQHDNSVEEVPIFTLSNPSSKIWKGVAVTKVKAQKKCGSCWAFSAVAALESRYKIAGGPLKSFLEQEVLDCSG